MRYRDAGVDINAASRAKSQIKELVSKTFNPRVLRGFGAFGGFFSLKGLPRDAVLVSSMDGVGTKLKIAFAANRHEGVARDLVFHSVNDIAVHGARPLFFLDYLATGKIRGKVVTDIVRGLSDACRQVGCALIGGETAQMPGFYAENEYDLAGCIVGWVRQREILDGSRIRPGDVILGLPSLGLHTNGYSLARKVLIEQAGIGLSQYVPELGRRLDEELLAPHRCYGPMLDPLHQKGWLNGLVHITGGGITENTPRILPANCQAEIQLCPHHGWRHYREHPAHSSCELPSGNPTGVLARTARLQPDRRTWESPPGGDAAHFQHGPGHAADRSRKERGKGHPRSQEEERKVLGGGQNRSRPG